MSVRLFVGNLAYDVTEADLREAFSAVGTPLSVRIPTDRETGKPRGFAVVEWREAAQAEEVIRRFHQQVLKGRPLVINEARPREEGAGPRPESMSGGFRSSTSAPMDRPPRPEAPTRTFGPDAAPRNKRRDGGRGGRGERGGPKKPIPTRGGGQFFSGGVDDDAEDQGADDVAFWMRSNPESSDQE